MTEIRDPICIRELLKDRKELCIIPFFISRAREKYEEILKTQSRINSFDEMEMRDSEYYIIVGIKFNNNENFLLITI